MSKDKKTLQVNELAAENTSNADLEVVSEAAVDAVMKNMTVNPTQESGQVSLRW